MNNQNNLSRDVFISYRHNHIDLVDPVIEELERRKISYFIDRDGINGGMDYSELIPKAIDSCKVFLFFWTSDANQSSDMLREVKIALDYGKSIIPYKIGFFDIKSHSSLHYFFSTICYFEVEKQTSNTIVDIVNQVEKALQDIQQPVEIKKMFQEAENGDAEAQTNLGWRYIRGDGVKQDEPEAIKWFSKAAEQGYTAAQFLLSMCYSNGNGVSKDAAKAKEWWYKSLNQDIAATLAAGTAVGAAGAVVGAAGAAVGSVAGAAATIAGVLTGPLVFLPIVGALCLGKTAENASDVKKKVCDVNHDNIPDVKQDKIPQDITQALKEYQKAAQQGNSKAQSFLGYCYANGVGVIKDVAEAKKWYQQAAQQGDKDAVKALKELK